MEKDSEEYLDQENLVTSWDRLIAFLEERFGKTPDLNAVLLLIGVQELGKGKQYFSKEEKQDLMHIAICKVMSFSGYYELKGLDQEGWPHWALKKKLPFFDLIMQENLLKNHIIQYFREEVSFDI